MSHSSTTLLALALAASPSLQAAQEPPVHTELLEVTGSDTATLDAFGGAIAVDAGRAIVGAEQNDSAGIRAGAAYIFDLTSGAETAALYANDALGWDSLGCSVAIHGNLALVGACTASHDGLQAGAAYLFDATTGAQLGKLVRVGGEGGDLFGSSVAIDQNLAVVGAPFVTTLIPSGGSWIPLVHGAGYVFDAQSGAQLAELTPSDLTLQAMFGASLAVDGSWILVGAPAPVPG